MTDDRAHARPRLEAAGFFVLRTPLRPFELLTDWTDGGTAVETLHTEVAVQAERQRLIDRLKIIVAQPDVTEAIFLASPATFAALPSWLAERDARDGRLEHTLVRYVQRLASRATPFGLFAACSVGRVGSALNLEVGTAPQARRSSRIDNDLLFTLAQSLERRDDIRRALCYRPNASLYHLAGRWRYVYTTIVNGQRTFNLAALDSDDYLDATLRRARSGATVGELVDQLLALDGTGEITRSDAEAYVDELIEQQVVTSSLTPVVTGPEPIDDLIAQLESIEAAAPVAAALTTIRRQLATLDGRGLGLGPELYDEIRHAVDRLGVTAEPSRTFQVDLIKPAARATIDPSVVELLTSAVDVLHRIASPRRNDALRRFREAFIARYENRAVPLFDVLDEETGIGFERSTAPGAEGAPLLEGLPMPATADSPTPWTSRDAFLLSKLESIWRDGTRVLSLSPADIDALASSEPPPRLPDALCVVAVVAGGNVPDPALQVLVRGAQGPSGARLMGRFCHADPELHQSVAAHLAAEESMRPDAIYAEIVHLPDGRLGNVVSRPVLRRFEIPYLGRSSAPDSRQIPISDLVVTIADDRVVLRSVRLGREVIPRMTNAHTYRLGHGIYRFLCQLQGQGESPALGWSWGPLQSAAFLPRVVVGSVVLARAQWRVDQAGIASLIEGAPHQRFAAVQRWRRDQQLPRVIVLADDDAELPIDLDNVLSVETFLQLVKKRPGFVVVEMFPAPDSLTAHSAEGRFVHELIVPLERHASIAPVATPSALRAATPGPQRSFAPGSEWLYLKVYGGPSNIDSILSDAVAPIVDTHVAGGTIDRWFFVRYGDPDWHLRLRLHGDPKRLRETVSMEALEAIGSGLRDQRAWKVQIDTYEREIERYGGDEGMRWSEELFWHDSEAVVAILRGLSGDHGADARWRLCMKSWDLLLADFHFTLDAKRALVATLRRGLAHELRADKILDRAVGDRFRAHRRDLELLLDESGEADHPLADAIAVLRRRSIALEPVLFALHHADQTGRVSQPLTSLAASYLHMHANRLLRSSHRHQELVLYDFLERVYDGRLARARGRGRATPQQAPDRLTSATS